ncbi:uncharacterized protein VTP21DRAFT_10979 [Calcarisporiella thermophila]|uniref:uncharacterized protein n=1 Tax=Calcarisporiella thermophila TaxID=911321 RepID=UPI0037429C74
MSIDPRPFLENPKYFSVEPRGKLPFIIGVAGGPAAGKKSACHLIVELLRKKKGDYASSVATLSLQNFYRELNDEEKALAKRGEWNFDHPDAFDFELAEEVLTDLAAGKSVEIPSYDFETKKRVRNAYKLDPPDVVILEGILLLYTKPLRDLMHMKIFVDVDSDTRLARRVIHQSEVVHSYSVDYILQQYVKFVKPSFEEFILPTKKYADVIIPRGSDNLTAINLLADHIYDLLKQRRSTSENLKEGADKERNLAPPLASIANLGRSTPSSSPALSPTNDVLDIRSMIYTPVPE